MDLRQLRQFVTLAETLNFRRAALRLHMSQPPLSISIRKLEAELGASLFARDRQGVRLSEAGVAALGAARASLFYASEFIGAAKAAVSGEGGRLRVGFVGSATYELMPRVLPEFRRRYPGVRLEMHEETNTKIVARLEANDLDVGLLRVPFTFQSRIQTITIETDTFVAALPAQHHLARRKRLSTKDLINESFVHYAASDVPGLHAVTMQMFENAGFQPKVTQEAFQVATVICLVESGLGVALVPSRAQHSGSKHIVFRRLEDAPKDGVIGLAIGFDPKHESATAKRFREVVTKLRKTGGVVR
jgi:DNA-binding transcriptional LysR family regulator